MRKQGLENMVVTGKIDGKRGRPRLNFVRSPTMLMHVSEIEAR